MPVAPAIELRLELYSDGTISDSLKGAISRFLAEWWPETWDIKIPDISSIDHPAEWRAIIPLPSGETPETLHRRVEARISALDPMQSLHFRTRWAFHEAPNHQEVYEVRWASNPH